MLSASVVSICSNTITLRKIWKGLCTDTSNITNKCQLFLLVITYKSMEIIIYYKFYYYRRKVSPNFGFILIIWLKTTNYFLNVMVIIFLKNTAAFSLKLSHGFKKKSIWPQLQTACTRVHLYLRLYRMINGNPLCRCCHFSLKKTSPHRRHEKFHCDKHFLISSSFFSSTSKRPEADVIKMINYFHSVQTGCH